MDPYGGTNISNKKMFPSQASEASSVGSIGREESLTEEVWLVGYDWSQGAEDALQKARHDAEAASQNVVLWLISGVDERTLDQHRQNLERADALRERYVHCFTQQPFLMTNFLLEEPRTV